MTDLYRGPIISVFGPIGSGKTTTAKFLEGQHDFVKVSFADALREEVATALAVEEGKFSVELKARIIAEMLDPLTKEQYRPVLQWWGSYRRKQDKDYWIKKLLPPVFELVEKNYAIVIDDCRYANEYKALTQMGASFYRLDPNPETVIDATDETRNHASEKDWSYFRAHQTLAWMPVPERAERILADLRSRDLL